MAPRQTDISVTSKNSVLKANVCDVWACDAAEVGRLARTPVSAVGAPQSQQRSPSTMAPHAMQMRRRT
jgi:hypothetical protein